MLFQTLVQLTINGLSICSWIGFILAGILIVVLSYYEHKRINKAIQLSELRKDYEDAKRAIIILEKHK